MKCNVEFLVVAYIASMFVDWCFQTDWQATNKSKWGKEDDKRESFAALSWHSLVYGIGTMLLVTLFIPSLRFEYTKSYIALFTLIISHMIIDTRILVKKIMKWKGMSDKQINDTVNYGFMHIGIDHRLHEMVLLILSMFM